MDELLGGFAVIGVLIVAIPLALIILGLAIVFNGRREPDPSGVRTTMVYFGLVDFVALVVLVLGATSIMASLSSLIVDEDDRQTSSTFSTADEFDSFGFETDPGVFDEQPTLDGPDPNDVAIRDTIQAGIVVVPALLIFLFHWRRREALVAEPGFEGSPGNRVDRIYLYTMCFVTALLGAIAVGRGVYDLFRLIIPGITSDLGDNSLERKEALSDLLTMLVLGGLSVYIFFWHWRLVSGETELWKRLGSGSPSPPAPDTSASPPPPPTGG